MEDIETAHYQNKVPLSESTGMCLERVAHDDRHTKKPKTTATTGELPSLLALLRVTDGSIHAITYTLLDPRLVLKQTMIQQRWMSRSKECNRTARSIKKVTRTQMKREMFAIEN